MNPTSPLGETVAFAARGTAHEIEEGLAFAPKFDAAGLIACIATDARSGELLMVAHMNAEALSRTIQSGEAWFFSRSRQSLWKKGETSGHVLKVTEMRVDCDQDAVWIKVEAVGPGACHTGRRSCFYRVVARDETGGALRLMLPEQGRAFDPASVYGAHPQEKDESAQSE